MDTPHTPAAAPVIRGDDPDVIFSDSMETLTPGPQPSLVPLAVRVLNKCAYGPRPGDVVAFNAMGGNDDARLLAWVNQQLNPDVITDTDCDNHINAGGYTTRNMTVPQLWAQYVRGNSTGWPQRYYPCEEAYCIKLLRAVYSKRQLFEVMVDFWHNHFNVQGWEFGIAPVFMHYDRDVMRGKHPTSQKHYALGNFRAMLEEVAKSPAMLMYLDNKSSRRDGFNENFARELCELHTLGAMHYYPGNDPAIVPDNDGDGIPDGYCDNDVYEIARAFTGWTMRDDHWEFPNTPEYDTGEFLYYPDWHDPFAKFVVGLYILASGPAMSDGRKVLDRLCQHPATARHICLKLCRRFISDDPPQALVESAATIWRAQWQAPDQIAQVLRHILTSEAFKATWGEKTKRPWEALMHSLRATSAVLTPRVTRSGEWDGYSDLNSRIQQTGNGPFRWPTPDGYPDHSRKWQAVSPLSQTWRTLSRLTELREPGSGDTPFLERIEQTTKSGIPTNQRTAIRLVDFWIERFYGYEIEAGRRQRLIDFMRQNAAEGDVLNLDEDHTPTSGGQAGIPQHTGIWQGNNLRRHYTIARLRAMVALLAMCPEFHHR